MKHVSLLIALIFLLFAHTVYAQECTQPSCFQQKDKELTGLANTTSAADKVPYYIDVNGNMSLANFTAFGRSLVGAANVSELVAITGVGSSHAIEDEGTPLTQRATMNFVGSGVTATDAGGKTVVTIPGGGAGHVIRDDGSDLAAQPNLNFVGGGITCINDVGNSETECTVLGGHVIKNEGSALTQRPNINFVGAGINCVDDAGNSETECTVATGAESDPTVAAIVGIVKSDGATISAATADVDYARADADTKALADNATAGFWAAATNVARSFANGTGITWTNPAGIAGNPQANVTSTVMMTDRSNTVSTGNQSFAAATSLTVPIAPNATTTTNGRIVYDSTNHIWKYAKNGVAYTILDSGTGQPLNANLTGLAAVGTPANNQVYLYHSGAWGLKTHGNCNAANQGLSFDSTTGNYGCNTFSGGLSGGVAGKGLIATGATTFDTSGIYSEAAGVAHIAGGIEINCLVASTCVNLDLNTFAGHVPYALAVPWPGAAGGSIGITIGARTSGEVVKFNADGAMVAGGAAGAGDATDTSVKDFTNLTLDVEGTGNVITTVSYIQLDFASCSGGVASLQWDDDATGDTQPTAACNDTGTLQRPSASFSGSAKNAVIRNINLPPDQAGNIDLTIRYASIEAAPSGNVEWEISTACRAAGETWDGSFNAVQTITDAVAAQYVLNDATQTSITLTGCAAGEDMTLKVGRDGAGDSNNDVAHALWARLKIRRAQ